MVRKHQPWKDTQKGDPERVRSIAAEMDRLIAEEQRREMREAIRGDVDPGVKK